MTDLMLTQVLDFDQLHRVSRDAVRVVAGCGEDWPQYRVFRKCSHSSLVEQAAYNRQNEGSIPSGSTGKVAQLFPYERCQNCHTQNGVWCRRAWHCYHCYGHLPVTERDGC